MALPALGPILFATIATPCFEETLQAYEEFLDHQVVSWAPLSEEQAQGWGLPNLAGRTTAILSPAGVSGGAIRLIEAKIPRGHQPLRNHGWAAVELIVADVDAVAAKLESSPFSIIGPAQGLSGRSVLRAMQVAGPAGEVLYLTSISGDMPGFDLPRTDRMVDRVFIAVLAAKDLEESRAFYESQFAVKRVSDREVAIGVINRAYGFPADRKHRLSSLQLNGQCLIEIDQYPSDAAPIARLEGEFPPGVAMISFASDRNAILRGPAGELIELVEIA